MRILHCREYRPYYQTSAFFIIPVICVEVERQLLHSAPVILDVQVD